MSAELVQRTKAFAIRIIKLVQFLPTDGSVGSVLGKQLLRSGTSIGANYRSALRSRSDKDFVSRIAIAIEEADETMYWLELLAESGLVKLENLAAILNEADQLTAILTAISITKKKNILLSSQHKLDHP
jgi:four helix bundle protein